MYRQANPGQSVGALAGWRSDSPKRAPVLNWAQQLRIILWELAGWSLSVRPGGNAARGRQPQTERGEESPGSTGHGGG
jgi:hypothetical protein